nr:MAG TPA: hypothetical protein [Caudoviricetes sp.]DAP59652.1 MAG TPA: hypothetical protein [Caudoviricetes sp.]
MQGYFRAFLLNTGNSLVDNVVKCFRNKFIPFVGNFHDYSSLAIRIKKSV